MGLDYRLTFVYYECLRDYIGMKMKCRNISPAFVHVVVLSLATFTIYANALKNGFVWDDTIFTIGNNTYKYFDLWNVIFNRANGVEYLPIRDLSFAVDYAVWGEIPYGFHYTNLGLFIATVLVVYLFAKELVLTLNPAVREDSATPSAASTAFFISLLFVVHPIQSSSVAFITNRGVVLSGFFFFLSLYYFLKFHYGTIEGSRRKYYFISILCFLLSILSKATVIILPLIIGLIGISAPGGLRRKRLLSIVPFVIISGLFFYIFKDVAILTKVIREDSHEFGVYNGWMNAAKTLQIPFFYLFKLFIPRNFAAEYDVSFSNFLGSPLVLACASAMIVITWFAWRFRKSHQEYFFGWAWFIISLLPVMHFFPTNPIVADRYVFLPVFGIFFSVIYVVYRLSRQMQTGRSLSIALGVLLAILAYLTHEQNKVWESDITLWTDTVQKAPSLSKGHANLGYAYLKEDDYDRAYDQFRRAQSIDPTMPDYEYAHGMTSFKRRRYGEAIQWFESALKRKPGHLRSLYFLGIAYEKNGDIHNAIMYLNRVSDSPEPDLNQYKLKAGFLIRAHLRPKIDTELKTLKLKVENNANDRSVHLKLASSYFTYGLFEEAMREYRRLVDLGYGTSSIFWSMGEVLNKTGNQSEAMEYYNKSLTLDNANCKAGNSIGLAYKKIKRIDEAIQAWTAVLLVNSSCMDAEFNLGVVFFQLGNGKRARFYFNDLVNKDSQFFNAVQAYLLKIE